MLDSANAIRLKDVQLSLKLATQAYERAARKGDSEIMAGANLSRGIASYMKGDYDAALANYLNALDYYESALDTVGQIRAFAELIIFYSHENKPEEAKDIIRKSMARVGSVKDPVAVATLHNNAGLFYLKQKEIDSATAFFQTAYTFYEYANDKVGMSYSLDYLSSTLAASGHLEAAMRYLKISRALRVETGDKVGEAMAINNIGELLLMQNRPLQSLTWFRGARDSALKLDFKDLAAHTWKMEAQAQEEAGHFSEAFAALKEYQSMHEVLMNEKRVAAVEELQTKYETEKKERLNLSLQQINKEQELKITRRNVALMGVAILVLLAVLIAYLFYNRYRLKQRARLQEEMLRQQKLRAEAVISAEEHERQRLARELHDGVGQMLAVARRSLQVLSPATAEGTEGSRQALQLLDESMMEVRQLSHSMMPPALRDRSLTEALDELALRLRQSSGMRIETEWTGTQTLKLDTNQSLMIYRAFQELMSNIIRHAGASEVTVEMVHHGTSLNLVVIDNGRGFDPQQMAAGLGLKNIRSRIGFIGGEVTMDSRPGQGATCIIDVPLE